MSSLVSLFLGGAIVVISNFIFATFAFSFVGGSDPDKVLKGFYRGGIIKVVVYNEFISSCIFNVKN